MKNLIISIPEGHEIDMSKSSLETGTVVFKIKEIKLPTTNEKCIPFLPKDCYLIDSIGNIEITNDSIEMPNTITSEEYAEAFLALMQLIKFRDIWNEGWKADWSNGEGKYVIYIKVNKKATSTFTYANCPLAFKSEELRDKFSETFDELIHKAKPLL